jgi:hypothetical protein
MIDLISSHIGEIVSNINLVIVGEVDNNIGKNTFCQTKWARKGKRIQNLDTLLTFNIINVEEDYYIDALPVGAGTFGSGTYVLPAPFYIHGTKKATNREWTISTNDLTQKTPIIWLLGPVRYTAFGRESSKEYEADLRLFFLDETDPTNYYTEDHLEQVVYPMEQLANEFLLTLQNDSNYATIDQWEVIEFSRFGTEQDNGFFQNILDANLSGVELRFTLTRYKNNICKC